MRRLAPALLTLALAACSTASPTPSASRPGPDAPRALGLVEVTFSGLGRSSLATSARSLGLGPAALANRSGVSLNPGSGPVALARGTFDFAPAGEPRTSGSRYLYATFAVNNASGYELSNVAFVAAEAGGNAPGTAVSSLVRFNGAAYSPTERDAIAIGVKPTGVVAQGRGPNGLPRPALLLDYTDALQVYDEAELPAAPGGATQLFPYGFTVSSGASGSRTLQPGTSTGLVTFAVKLPLQASAQDDPFSFSMTFAAVTDSAKRVTQPLEGQDPVGAAAVQARAAALGAELNVLPGTTLTGRRLCQVRTAGPASSPTAGLVSSVPAPFVDPSITTLFVSRTDRSRPPSVIRAWTPRA